jgi:hypothetical protein
VSIFGRRFSQTFFRPPTAIASISPFWVDAESYMTAGLSVRERIISTTT